MQCVYLGPSRAFNLPLKNGSILAAKPEVVFPELAGIFGEHPDFRRLFIPLDPVNTLVQARRLIKEPGTPLNHFYNEFRGSVPREE